MAVGLMAIALLYLFWFRCAQSNGLNEHEGTGGHHSPHAEKESESPVLPGVSRLSAAFQSTEERIMRIGASLTEVHAWERTCDEDYGSESSVASSYGQVASRPRSDRRVTPTLRPPSLTGLNGEFTSALTQAFGSPTKRHEFPISAHLTNSTNSPVSVKPAARRPETIAITPIQSLRGSITEALSMIAFPDRISGSSPPLDINSVKSGKSLRSMITQRLRLSVSVKVGRQSTASFATVAPSSMMMPSPDPADVNVLFSGSQESIAFGMPSVPPTSFASAPTYLDGEIPQSPMNIPGALMLFKGSPSPPRSQDEAVGGDAHQSLISPIHPAAIETALLFDPALSLLEPASPSSDGVMFGLGSSDSSVTSSRLNGNPPPGGLASAFRLKLNPASNNSVGKHIGSPGSSPLSFSASLSPTFSTGTRPSPVLVASLTSKSLSLAEAMDTLETEAIYASFPTTPDKNAMSPAHSSPSIISILSSPERLLSSPSHANECMLMVPPVVASEVDLDDGTIPSSVDITVANLSSQRNLLATVTDASQTAITTSTSGRSTLSMCIDEIIKEKNLVMASSLSEELPPDDIDIVDISPIASPLPSALSSHSTFHLESTTLSASSNLGTPQLNTKPSASSSSNEARAISALIVDSENKPPPKFPRFLNLSSSAARLSVSVIPIVDETAQLIEDTLLQIQMQALRYELGEDCDHEDEEEKDDDGDIDSFEGDVSYLSPGFLSPSACTTEDDRRIYDPATSGGDDSDWISAYETEIGGTTFLGDGGFNDHRPIYHTLDYPHNHDSFIPRQAEVALRAIAREGRIPESDHFPRQSPFSSVGFPSNSNPFVPLIPSPLRVSHRAASRCSNETNESSDVSMYSQASDPVKPSAGGWVKVF